MFVVINELDACATEINRSIPMTNYFKFSSLLILGCNSNYLQNKINELRCFIFQNSQFDILLIQEKLNSLCKVGTNSITLHAPAAPCVWGGGLPFT